MLTEKLFCVFRRDHPILKRGVKFDIVAVLSFPHVIVSATGNRVAIFDDLLLRHRLRRKALVAVSNFTAVPHLLARSDMIGVFTELASSVFERSFKLAKRAVPINVGKYRPTWSGIIVTTATGNTFGCGGRSKPFTKPFN
jgi:hypothetical protein